MFSTFLTAGLFATAFAAPTMESGELVVRAQNTTNITCSTGVHMFVNRGHIYPLGDIGPMDQMVSSISALIPNSTYYATPYKTNTANNLFYYLEVNPGAKVLIDNITSYVAQCPQTPIVLLGWSEGAAISMNALCGSSTFGFIPPFVQPLSTSYVPNIIAVIDYGDETRAPNQSYDEGSCTSGGSAERSNPAGCDPWAASIQSYCLYSDPYCCSTGNNSAAHGYYFGLYDKTMAKFVQSRYKSFQANLTANATPSS